MGDRSGRAHILCLRGAEVWITLASATGDESGKRGRPPHEQLLKWAEKTEMQDLTPDILTQYIGGSVSWPDTKNEPVVSWRSGQVNLGFSLKAGVGENWSIHEALRDLKSDTFCDTLDMRICFGD